MLIAPEIRGHELWWRLVSDVEEALLDADLLSAKYRLEWALSPMALRARGWIRDGRFQPPADLIVLLHAVQRLARAGRGDRVERMSAIVDAIEDFEAINQPRITT